jgi:hypothetical protein
MDASACGKGETSIRLDRVEVAGVSGVVRMECGVERVKGIEPSS